MSLSTIILEAGGVFASAVNQDGSGNIGVNVENSPTVSVSGTVAVTQSGSWSVSVNNFPSSSSAQIVDGPNATYWTVIQGAAGYSPIAQIQGSATKTVKITRMLVSTPFLLKRFSSGVTTPVTPVVGDITYTTVGADGNNIATVVTSNSVTFPVGASVVFAGLTGDGTYLNGNTYEVDELSSPTQFNFSVVHANYSGADTGTATWSPTPISNTASAANSDTNDSSATAAVTYYTGTGNPTLGTLVSTIVLWINNANVLDFGTHPGTEELTLRGTSDYIVIEPVTPASPPSGGSVSVWIEWTEA